MFFQLRVQKFAECRCNLPQNAQAAVAVHDA